MICRNLKGIRNQKEKINTRKYHQLKKKTSLFSTRWANCGYDLTVLKCKVRITTRRRIEHHTGICH